MGYPVNIKYGVDQNQRNRQIYNDSLKWGVLLEKWKMGMKNERRGNLSRSSRLSLPTVQPDKHNKPNEPDLHKVSPTLYP